MKDFYGEDLAVGDKVLYATAGYSRKPYLREGKVEKINDADNRISIRQFKSSGGSPVNRVKHVDLRTGKFVDPWNHRKVVSHWIHKDTKEKLEGSHYAQFIWDKGQRVPNAEYVPHELWEHVENQHEDYLLEIQLIGGRVSVINGSDRVVKVQ